MEHSVPSQGEVHVSEAFVAALAEAGGGLSDVARVQPDGSGFLVARHGR